MSHYTLPMVHPWLPFTPPSAHWSHYHHTFCEKGSPCSHKGPSVIPLSSFLGHFFFSPLTTCSPYPKGLPSCPLLWKYPPSLNLQLSTSLFPPVLEARMEALNKPGKPHCHNRSCLDRVLWGLMERLGTRGRQVHRSPLLGQDCF